MRFFFGAELALERRTIITAPKIHYLEDVAQKTIIFLRDPKRVRRATNCDRDNVLRLSAKIMFDCVGIGVG